MDASSPQGPYDGSPIPIGRQYVTANGVHRDELQPDGSIKAVKVEEDPEAVRRRQRMHAEMHRCGFGDPDATPAQRLRLAMHHRVWLQNQREDQLGRVRPSQRDVRLTRGGGRRGRRPVSRTASRGGDSGDDGPGEPPPGRGGAPRHVSFALAAFLEELAS